MFFSMPERMDLENQVRSSSLSEVITSEGDKQRTDYYDENGQKLSLQINTMQRSLEPEVIIHNWRNILMLKENPLNKDWDTMCCVENTMIWVEISSTLA